jgi:hypothetical protein
LAISETLIAVLSPASSSFVDADAAAAANRSFYRIRSVGCTRQLYNYSAQVGAFSYALAPGTSSP